MDHVKGWMVMSSESVIRDARTMLRAGAATRRSWDVALAVFAAVCIAVSYAMFCGVGHDARLILGEADGIFETLGAVWLLAGAVSLLIQFCQDRLGNCFFAARTKRNVFLLLGAIIFFFGAGEKVGWGQRQLHYQVPAYFQKHNLQNEVTLHNLEPFQAYDGQHNPKTGLAKLITANFLFNAFWFLCFVLVPLANSLNRSVHVFLRIINFPLVPLWISALFLANYVLSKILSLYFSGHELWSLGELKESNYEMLLGLAALWLFLRVQRTVTTRAAA
jgi:hypothetical protein